MNTNDNTRQPLLGLMPGLGGSGRLFRRLIAELDAQGRLEHEVRVIHYSNGTTLQDYIDAVLDQIPSNRPVSLVAESFSGPIAIALMAKSELDIGPSVLCNTFCHPPYRMMLPLIRPIPPRLLKSSDLTAPLLRWFCAGPYADANEWAEILTSIRETDRDLLKQQVLALRKFEVAHLLAEVETPVLYLQSTSDRLINHRAGQKIVTGLRNCVVENIDGPHLLLQMSGQRCAELILRHIQKNV